MKAFALPSFSEGYVRLNVKGREAHGTVDPSDYDRALEEISDDLRRVTDPRTGGPAVRDVVRTRRDAFRPLRDEVRPADADLIVMWTGTPVDVVDHPKAGRIGPVPFKRSGSHVHRGFFLAVGQGLPAGIVVSERHALDLAPSVLALMGAPIPSHFEGRPILEGQGKPAEPRPALAG
jgi:predicted AlkP superfamily phosphohydrolase/phosphomutase